MKRIDIDRARVLGALAISITFALPAGCGTEDVTPIVPGCVPTSCTALGAECGPAGDGCGGVLDCGRCGSGEACGVAAANQCGALCTPLTCTALGADCGTQADGCGSTIACGECPSGETCGGGGANRCGTGTCTPTTCEALGADCGPAGDGCGGVLDCGTCASGEACGVEMPSVCGEIPCTPITCSAIGAECGTIPDGCGGDLTCPACPSGEVCGVGGANRCGPMGIDAGDPMGIDAGGPMGIDAGGPMGIDAGPPVPDGGGAPCSFTDARDGTVYRCVTIGSATWMAENLRIGTTVVGGAVTSGSEEPCLCDDGRLERFCNQGTSWGEAPVASVGEMNCDNYGGLYSWSEAMQLPSWCARQAPRTPLVDTVAACNAMLSVPHRGICPAGWHLPQRVEWEALLAAAGGVAANLRPTLPDTCYVGDDGRTYCFPWTGTNSTGFSALPSGYRYTGGVYAEVGVSETAFWSSEPLIAIGPLDFRGPYAVSSATFAVSREGAEVRIRVRGDYATSRDTNHDDAALSVRCVRD